MQELKAEKPAESPEGNPVTRLMNRLRDEGFTTEHAPEDLYELGEVIFRRDERIAIATGATVFIFTRVPDISEKILRQTSDAVVHTYKAKGFGSRALSVLQSTTVFHCLVSEGDHPHNELLNEYIVRSGGATFIPVVMVPEINYVHYPDLQDKVGTLRARVEFLQFLLGERREGVNMHRQTTQAFYISMTVAVLLLVVVVASLVMH